MKFPARGLVILSLAIGTVWGEPQLHDYALILADPPLARQVGTRAELHTAMAAEPDLRIQAAQRSVTDDLVRRNVRVTGSARVLLNAVFVRTTSDRVKDLRSIPGVTRVVYLPPAHRKLDKAAGLVNASAGWSAVGGVQQAGAGVKIGILDTGIDQTHPAFQDASLTAPAGFPKGDPNYTNHKVIVARSYVAMLPFEQILAADSRPDDNSPRDRSGHGTAIAMIAAGEKVTAPLATIQGIAPKAFLGNYKIFGSPGVNDTTTFPVIVKALEDAIADGMDIVALPVGDPALYGPLQTDPSCAANPPQTQPLGIPSDACDVRAQAVENAVKLKVTVVVPAGNDADTGVNYPALSSIDTPGTAPSAITVGATTNAHVFYESVIVPMKNAPTRRFNALFGDGQQLSSALSAPLRDVSLLGNDGFACAALKANSLAGAIALIQRGTCAFADKVTNAANAGAVGAIIVQTSGNQTPFSPTGLTLAGIPAVMVGSSDGAALQTIAKSNPQQQVTLDPTPFAVDAAADAIAEFSSRGPAILTGAIKPDLVAPGADLYTAGQSYDPNGDLYSPSGYTSAQGTSFAVGLAAGAAALVKQAHPNFTPGQIKSALVNTASGNVTDNGATARIVAAGAGKLNVGAAVTTPVTVEPATLSFGALDQTVKFPLAMTLTLTNVTASSMRFDTQVQPTDSDSLAHVTVAPNTGLLGPGQTKLTVQLQGGLSTPGSYEGFILIHLSATTLRIPYLYVVSDGNPDNALLLGGATFSGSAFEQGFYLILKLIDRFGVGVTGVPAAFNVAVGDGAIVAADGATDIDGIAAAQVDLGSQLGDQIFTADVAGTQVEFDGRARLQPTINSNGVVNAGSHQVGQGLAPGSYIEIYGVALSEATKVASTAYLPVALAGVSVSFDAPGISVPGHIFFVTPGQVDVQIPWELQGQTSASMKVSVDGSESAVYTVPLADSSPAAFEIHDLAGSGTVAAALDSSFKIISSANPAKRTQSISLYVNGLGAVTNQPVSGDPTPAKPFAVTRATPVVKIGGVNAQMTFNGLAPYNVGLYQLNVTVPGSVKPGLQPVVITINGKDSKASNLPVQ
ncbi:MAG TPA: S8 family serine peptidase [Bryobacteraceae bacterium]|nr:S8 family serine peptidase [Bryobacteraceae bacterium]